MCKLWLTSSSLKFFLSEIMTSFQTTSTPSSASMAKYAASIPGTLRWLTYGEKYVMRRGRKIKNDQMMKKQPQT